MCSAFTELQCAVCTVQFKLTVLWTRQLDRNKNRITFGMALANRVCSQNKNGRWNNNPRRLILSNGLEVVTMIYPVLYHLGDLRLHRFIYREWNLNSNRKDGECSGISDRKYVFFAHEISFQLSNKNVKSTFDSRFVASISLGSIVPDVSHLFNLYLLWNLMKHIVRHQSAKYSRVWVHCRWNRSLLQTHLRGIDDRYHMARQHYDNYTSNDCFGIV